MCNNTQATMLAVKQQTRIALVEDDLDLLHSTQEFLTALGFYVWGEPSAEAFFRRFSAEPVDVVVLDIGLPGEDGLSVASLLRANRYLAVIILSARDSLEDRLVKNWMKDERFEEEPGMHAWMPSPVSTRLLRVITKKPMLPSDAEIQANPRARSAKLRVARLLAPTP